jgi:uncharacterized protein YecE (DUF72 family)
VEIDSTTYNFPSTKTVQNWVESTPKQFIFHIKLFGFLCSRSGSRRSLPKSIRALLPETEVQKEWLYENELPTAAIQQMWDMSNNMLTPLIRANKLGVVVLQFHTTFHPNSVNTEYIRRCRRRLRSDCRMAVEFRQRSWLRGAQRTKTLQMLAGIEAGLVASDDLEHEVRQRDRDQQGLTDGQARVRLRPVVASCVQPEFLYCRVHRRHGIDRLLRDDALQDWATLLSNVEDRHVYFLLGTDHREQPVTNARALSSLLPQRMCMNWQQEVREGRKMKRGSLLSMLSSTTEADAKTASNDKAIHVSVGVKRKKIYRYTIGNVKKSKPGQGNTAISSFFKKKNT